MVFDEFNLSGTVFMLEYNCVAPLSSQFKKITGLTPRYYKKMGGIRGKLFDKI